MLRAEAEHILKHAKEAPEGDYLLIVDESSGFSLKQSEQSSAEQMGIPHELLQQLISHQVRRAAWAGDGSSFRGVTNHEINDIFRRSPDWPQFYSRYPRSRGFVEFTGPVFSADGSEALLYESYSCYGDCGWGSLVLYKKTGERWAKVNEWLHWIS